MADGWTTGGVDVVGAAGPLPGQSHDRSHDITCTHPFFGGWGGGGGGVQSKLMHQSIQC